MSGGRRLGRVKHMAKVLKFVLFVWVQNKAKVLKFVFLPFLFRNSLNVYVGPG